MSKCGKGPAGRRPPKAWVAEPYQPGQVYYDPTTDPGPLRMARLWFSAKYPNISCLLGVLFFLGIITGYIWLIVFAFLQSEGNTNWWLFLGIGLIVVPLLILITFLMYRLGRRIFRKPSLPLGPPGTPRPKRHKRTSDDEQPPKLFDPDDPAGFAQMLPYRRVRGLPKLRKPRSKSQKKREKKTQAAPDQECLDTPG